MAIISDLPYYDYRKAEKEKEGEPLETADDFKGFLE